MSGEAVQGGAKAQMDPALRRRGLVLVAVAVGTVGFAMSLQMGLNANFLADVMGVSGFELGVLEGVRETCGVTALVVLALLAGLAEPVVGAAMLALVAVGLAGYAFVPSFAWLVAVSVVWSQGLHVWMPLPNAMTLSLAEPGREGYRVGQVRAAASVGFGAGIVVALVLSGVGVAIRPMFLVAGGVLVVAVAACLGVPRGLRTRRPRLVVRRRYLLYYVLSFLEGWRKQIFMCFAGFLLVRVYGTRLEVILVLHGLVQAVGFVAAPRVGRVIDRVGERRVLVFYYVCLTVFFVGYAFIRNVWVLYALFVVDSSYFVFATALTTYVSRIAPRGEHTPTLSMGVATSHVAAVLMPLIGGVLWETLGYRWAFLVGAAAAGLSVVVALRVPRREEPASGRTPPAGQPGAG